MKNLLKNHRFLAGFFSVVISVFLVGVVVYGATTIGTNINTGGTVTMESASSTNDFWLGNVIADDDDYLYMDASGSQYLMWDDNPGLFQLSSGLKIIGNATTTGNMLVGTASWGGSSATSTFIVSGSALFTTKASSSDAFAVGRGTINNPDMSGGDLYVSDDLEVDGSIWFSSGTTTDSFAIGGYASSTGALNTQSNFHAGGNATIDGTFISLGAATTTKSHYIGGTASTTELFVQGAGHIGGNLTIDGSATTTKSHYIGGTASTTELFVQGAGHIGGNADVDGTFTIGTSTNAITNLHFGRCTVDFSSAALIADIASTTICSAPGARGTDTVMITPLQRLKTGLVFMDASATTDQIIVRVWNASSSAITGEANLWSWMAIH